MSLKTLPKIATYKALLMLNFLLVQKSFIKLCKF